MALPEVRDPLLVEPCFIPRNPRSGLAWFTAHKSEDSQAAGTFKTLSFVAGKPVLEPGTEFTLPTGYEKILAKRRPQTRLMPWISRRKDWTLSIGRLPLAPLYLPPYSLSTLRRFAIRLQGSDCPPASDLDRDGVPELWFLPNLSHDPLAGGSRLAELSTAPGRQPKLSQGVNVDWLKQLTDLHAVTFWDLDEDQFEDVIAMRGQQDSTSFKNASDLDLDKLPVESGLLDRSNEPVRQEKLCLGPQRRQLQWALAYGAEEASPLLLHRKDEEWTFREFEGFTKILAQFHVLDARIFDLDGDAVEELLLLVQRYPDPGATDKSPPAWPSAARIPTQSTRPRRRFARLKGVVPELRLYKLGKGSATAPILIDQGLAIAGATGLRLGDLDGDTAPDLVVTRGLQRPRLFRNVTFMTHGRRFYRLALRGPEDYRQAIGSYVELYDPDSEERLARYRWPPLQTEDQPLLWLTFALDHPSELAGVLITWADGQAFPLEDLVRGQYRFETR